MNDFDVIIIGRTITGLSLACGLSNNLKIAILNDKCDKQKSDGSSDFGELNHVSMISLAAVRFLQYIKIWDNHIVNYANPFCSIKVTEGDSFNSFIFKESHLGYPCLGYIINNLSLYKELLRRVYKLKNVFFVNDIYSCCLITKKNTIYVVVNNQRSLSSKLVVVTSSYQDSLLYRSLDISLTFRSNPYFILVGTIFSEHCHFNVVHYCFQKRDILILLPLSELNCFSVFWLLHSSSEYLLCNFNRENLDDLFVRSFNQLGKVSFQKDVNFIPCVSRYTKNFLMNRLLLLGSSASYDISYFKYRNVNKDLMDVAMLLKKINRCNFFHRNLGDFFDLNSYEKYKKFVAIKTFSQEQFIHSCFFKDNILNACIRTSIFQIMNRFSSIVTKFNFVNDLMGLNSVPDWLLTDYFD